MDSEGEAPRKVEEIIANAQKARASDIHFQTRDGTAQISFRIDGVMTPIGELEADIQERVFGRIKYLAKLKTYQESLPQDGRIQKSDVGSKHDIRVATYPTVTGEKIVLRLFSEVADRNLDELEFSDGIFQELKQFLRGNSGLLLLTGPAGSGKTTTIYACVRYLAAMGGRHIITIEDPAEQIIEGVMQTEVNEARGLTFAKAARHLLRQDPQILVIGEIRDDETACIAVRAAMTGHMVISTLHAGSCKGVYERLLMMCEDRFAVISSVALILNQILIRRLCAACQGDGCDLCFKTGYCGRVPIVEWYKSDDAKRGHIRSLGAEAVKPDQAISKSAREVLEMGLSDLQEYKRVCGL